MSPIPKRKRWRWADLVVVMDRGRIAQVGSPHEVYAAPRTAFVARFIGGHNVIGGQVQARDGALAVLAGPGAGRIAVPSPAAVDTPLQFAVRSDKVALEPAVAQAVAELAVVGGQKVVGGAVGPRSRITAMCARSNIRARSCASPSTRARAIRSWRWCPTAPSSQRRSRPAT